METTIVALATPPGAGGIAVVRLSGPESYRVTGQVFRPMNPEKKVSEAKGYTAMFGHFIARGKPPPFLTRRPFPRPLLRARLPQETA